MPCLVGLLALFLPRLTIIIVALVSDYIGQAYQTLAWPILGFCFMPLTTLAYAWAWHSGSGSVQGAGIVVIVLAVLMDLGIIGGGGSAARRRRAGRVNVTVVKG